MNDLDVYFDVQLKCNYYIDKIINRYQLKLDLLKRSCSKFSNPVCLKKCI